MKRLVIGFIAGAFIVGGSVALADEGDDLPKPVIRSYDIGSNAPRIVGWCFGADAIYQANESDGIAVAVASPNCVEGGLLANNN